MNELEAENSHLKSQLHQKDLDLDAVKRRIQSEYTIREEEITRTHRKDFTAQQLRHVRPLP